MDSADNFHYVDRKTNIPMSLLETHDLIFKTYLDGKPLAYSALSNEKKLVPELGICYGTGNRAHRQIPRMVPRTGRQWRLSPLPHVDPPALHAAQQLLQPALSCPDLPGPPLGLVRIRRLGRPADAQGPVALQKLHRPPQRPRLDHQPGPLRRRLRAKPGAINIQMATVTPGFETFLVRTDGGPWQPQRKQPSPGNSTREPTASKCASAPPPASKAPSACWSWPILLRNASKREMPVSGSAESIYSLAAPGFEPGT